MSFCDFRSKTTLSGLKIEVFGPFLVRKGSCSGEILNFSGDFGDSSEK